MTLPIKLTHRYLTNLSSTTLNTASDNIFKHWFIYMDIDIWLWYDADDCTIKLELLNETGSWYYEHGDWHPVWKIIELFNPNNFKHYLQSINEN